MRGRNMKVLVVLTGAMIYDGITNSVYNYYSAMDRTDMDIDIVSARSTMAEIKEKFENININVYQLECRDSHPLKYMLKLYGLLREKKYDIIHAHGNSATLALETMTAWLAQCKVRIVHSRNTSCEHEKIDKIMRPIMYATYTDGFACGQEAGKWLFKNRDYTVINNGKNIDKFLFDSLARQAYRQKLGVSDEMILLGHVGLFHKQKNHDFLIDIFNEIHKESSNYKLVLIGEGEEKERIYQKVKNANLEDDVLFLGCQNDVEGWLQALDIMVFPSWFEGMPNVVLEWQIAGLQALISDRITRECKITENVEYFPLELEAKHWAQKIMSIPVCQRDGKQEIVKEIFGKAGYDININARFLKQKYIDLIEKRG